MSRIACTCLLMGTLILGLAGSTASGDSEVFFTLLHTADEHSHLLPHSPTLGDEGRGGFARLAGAVRAIRTEREQQGEPVILVSAGDFVGGTPFSWLSMRGEAPELALMLAMEYDVITLGNHEFDYGGEDLALYLQNAGYPQAAHRTALVASNTHPQAEHPLAEVGIENTALLSLDNGLSLGFFGLIGDHALQVTPEVDGVSFSRPHEAAARAVDNLQTQGADVIVAVTHSGVTEDRALARQVPGIDLIVGGHCHTPLKQPIVEQDTLIVQSGALLNNLGVLELAFDWDSNQLSLRNPDVLLPLGPEIQDDPSVAQEVENYTAQLNNLLSDLTHGSYDDLTGVVAEMNFPLETATQAESALGNFVTDALRTQVERVTGEPVAVAVQPNGILRGSVYPHQDRISLYDLVWPLSLGHGEDERPGYPVVSFYLTGDEIRRTLEVSLLMSEILGDSGFLQVSGITSRHDPSRAVLLWLPFINQPLPSTRAVLTAAWEDGTPLSRGDEELYHAVTDYYTATFIPQVGDMLPSLSLTPKDARGNPLDDLREAIVHVEGEELKVWQAVLDYTSSLPPGELALPRIPSAYEGVEGRLEAITTTPLWVWPLLALALLLSGTSWLLIRRRRRKQNLLTSTRSG